MRPKIVFLRWRNFLVSSTHFVKQNRQKKCHALLGCIYLIIIIITKESFFFFDILSSPNYLYDRHILFVFFSQCSNRDCCCCYWTCCFTSSVSSGKKRRNGARPGREREREPARCDDRSKEERDRFHLFERITIINNKRAYRSSSHTANNIEPSLVIIIVCDKEDQSPSIALTPTSLLLLSWNGLNRRKWINLRHMARHRRRPGGGSRWWYSTEK